jgi:hypothetical protein
MDMKRGLMLTAVLFLVFAFCTTAGANLIQHGDFEDNPTIYYPEFTLGTSATGVWYGLADWTVETGGPLGSVYYFDHEGGDGGDYKAFQPVDTSAMSLAGQEITLSFDYIYEQGDWDIQSMGVAVVGLSGTGAQYGGFQGAGYDGWDSSWTWWSPGYDASTERDVLGTLSLLTTSGSGDWGSDSLTVLLGKDYDALIAVFAASTWDLAPSGIEGLRGIDNVSLAVPEPATMLLLGAGLIGLAGLGRKKFFKK